MYRIELAHERKVLLHVCRQHKVDDGLHEQGCSASLRVQQLLLLLLIMKQDIDQCN